MDYLTKLVEGIGNIYSTFRERIGYLVNRGNLAYTTINGNYDPVTSENSFFDKLNICYSGKHKHKHKKPDDNDIVCVGDKKLNLGKKLDETAMDYIIANTQISQKEAYKILKQRSKKRK